MQKPLSMDLRERLISAVEGGISRRSAAKFFSVASSTAIKWVDQQRRTGSICPRARGGDHRSHRLEAHADEILSLAVNTDLTLAELAEYLDKIHDLRVAPSTIWHLLDRHDMTYKKPHTPPSSNDLMPCADGKPGSTPRSILSWNGSCSSMVRHKAPLVRAARRTGRRPRWPDAMNGRSAVNRILETGA